MLNLYLLTRNGGVGWDQFDSFVVAASWSHAARAYAAERAGEWDGCDWRKASDATVKYIGKAGQRVKAGVVLGSFNAG